MAIGVIALVAGDVADIDVPDAFLHGYFAETDKGGKRGGRQPVQFVFWEKAQEM